MNKASLIRHWVHSHEEDTATEMVFRTAKYKFPRSRGRTAFELRADGSLVEHGIGPADVEIATTGAWREEPGQGIVFFRHGEKKPTRSPAELQL